MSCANEGSPALQRQLDTLGTLEDQPDQDAVVLGLADPQSRLNKMGTLEDQPDPDVDVLGVAGSQSIPTAATREHDDPREFLERVGRGAKEAVEMDAHQPPFKVTFLSAGLLQTPHILQCQWICEHDVPVPAVPWPRAAPRVEHVIPILRPKWDDISVTVVGRPHNSCGASGCVSTMCLSRSPVATCGSSREKCHPTSRPKMG